MSRNTRKHQQYALSARLLLKLKMLSVPRVVIVQIAQSAVFALHIVLVYNIVVRQLRPFPFFGTEQRADIVVGRVGIGICRRTGFFAFRFTLRVDKPFVRRHRLCDITFVKYPAAVKQNFFSHSSPLSANGSIRRLHTDSITKMPCCQQKSIPKNDSKRKRRNLFCISA